MHHLLPNFCLPAATKLVCSLGPSSHNAEVLEQMLPPCATWLHNTLQTAHTKPQTLPDFLILSVLPAATKLVCSLGPSSHNVEVLEEMLRAGMVTARIDLTWGGLDFHRATLAALNVS